MQSEKVFSSQLILFFDPREPDAFRSRSKNSGNILAYTDSELYGAVAYDGGDYKTALLGFTLTLLGKTFVFTLTRLLPFTRCRP